MRLVDDHHVPTGIDQRTEARRIVRINLLWAPSSPTAQRLDGIDRANHLIEHAPRIETTIHGKPLWADSNELFAEPLRHLSDPLQLDSLWSNDNNTAQPPAGFHLRQDCPSGDGLSKTDLVTDRQPNRIQRERTLQRGQLMWQKGDTSASCNQRFAIRRQRERTSRRSPPGQFRFGPPPAWQRHQISGSNSHSALRGRNDDLRHRPTPQLGARDNLDRLSGRWQPVPDPVGGHSQVASFSALRK